jgi:antitoxin (DNA-binding transcriptional repressor) of toxin-antitoxin stability system
MGPVIHACKKVVLTEHGREVASIIPIVAPDRKRAMQMLAAIGEVALPARK